jgi:shikimate kinase
MRIYLIGYMGSGKTTVGKWLAKALNLQFIDLDQYIEEKNNQTIPEIFASEGENSFRVKEQKALQEVSLIPNVIISTGGGAPCFFDNMEVINNTGISVYLNGTPQLLASRLLNSNTERPLIKGKSEAELIQFIHDTLEKRNSWYKQAQIVIGFNRDLNPSELVELVNNGIIKNRPTSDSP